MAYRAKKTSMNNWHQEHQFSEFVVRTLCSNQMSKLPSVDITTQLESTAR